MRNVVVICALLSLTLSHPLLAQTVQPAQTNGATDNKRIDLWLGIPGPPKGEFNDKLNAEGNRPLSGGLNLGIELSPFTVNVPGLGTSFSIPVCFEYSGATSKTTHVTQGAPVIVHWELPVVGASAAPTLALGDSKTSSALRARLYVRPIGLGIYTMGRIKSARLTVTDRPGSLEVKGTTLGTFSAAGLTLSRNRSALILEGGYRWLKFTDLSVIPREGFTDTVNGTVIKAGSLTELVDYSGVFLRAGVSMRF